MFSRLERSVLPARVMFLAAIAWQLATVALALTSGMGIGLPVLVVVGIAQGLCIVPMAVLQLRNAPPELRGCGIRIEVAAARGDGLEVLVQLVVQRDAGGDVQAGDVIV